MNKKYSNYEKHKKIANSKELKLNVEFSNYHGVTTNDKINYYPFECLKSNHTFERSLCWYSYNNNCPICAREKHDLEIFKSFEKKVNQRGGIVLEKSIATKDQRIKCLCKYKHNFNISHEKLKIGQWCGSCSRGVGERKCRAILEHILGINLPTKHPKILKNPKTGKCLQLDGFNEEHKIAFEYQGPHHKKHHVKIRDNFKKKVCKENGIVLIIIEEFKQNCSDKEKFTIILKKCKALKLNILNDRNNVDLSNTYTNENSVRNRIQRLLAKHNAKALIPFEDISVQMLIKCRNPNHKPFLMTPNNIIYHNGWCNECKKEFSKTVINENKFN